MLVLPVVEEAGGGQLSSGAEKELAEPLLEWLAGMLVRAVMVYGVEKY